jgi:positive regulator of sigma E activity
MRASALVYLLPIAGLLAGAGLAQLVATALFSPEAGGNAAGFGGIAGAALAVLLARRLAKRSRSPHGSLARITRIVDSPGSAG